MSKRVLGWSFLAVFWMAGPGEGAPQEKNRRLETELRLGGLFYGNFFQAPEGSPGENVSAAAVALRFSAKAHRALPLKAYGEIDYTAYRGLDSSVGFSGGLRLEGRPHGFEIYGQHLRGRPSFEVRDEFDRADVSGLGGEYSYRVNRDFEVSGLADYRRESLELSPAKNNSVRNLGGAVRYRGLGWRFSPEIGLRFGERDVLDDNEDYSQRELFLKFRWVPAPSAYVTARYRHRSRDYSVASRAASNFEREDGRKQWVVTADLRQGGSLTWNLYFASEDVDSTRSTRVFTTQVLGGGVTIHF